MNKKNNIYITIAVIALAAIALATGTFYIYKLNNHPQKVSQTQQSVLGTNTSKNITYKGKDGVSALNLLKQKYTTETSGKDELAFVTSINGVAANPKNEFWAFNINGKPATVGAGSYITKVGDTITWQLSSF